MQSHAVSECFSTLTGGRLGKRVSANMVAKALGATFLPAVNGTTLDASEIVKALAEAERRGVRGGAVYDFLHLMAAGKIGAKKLFTLNLADFVSFHRPGDPEIVHPAQESKAPDP